MGHRWKHEKRRHCINHWFEKQIFVGRNGDSSATSGSAMRRGILKNVGGIIMLKGVDFIPTIFQIRDEKLRREDIIRTCWNIYSWKIVKDINMSIIRLDRDITKEAKIIDNKPVGACVNDILFTVGICNEAYWFLL